jgi:hypothetical protein
MKVTVVRQLRSGVYDVAFKVGDFTTEELQKMASFGVPKIKMLFGPGRQQIEMAINQINEGFKASFTSEQEARGYESRTIDQIRQQMTTLRERKDDFSSSTEVAI